MVERYGFVTGQDGCGQPRFKPVTDTHKGQAFISATDYAALEAERDYLKMKIENAEKIGVTWTHIYDGEEAAGYPGAEDHAEQLNAIRAERDEWKRRCEAIVASLKPDGPPVPGGMFDKEVRVLWRAGINLHDGALAIAEGRDNG